MTKRGLVLSGGGAKGAYQAGMMKALLEMGVEVDMIAGASIGALNGAVLASAPDLPTGVARLEDLWLQIGQMEVLQVDKKAVLKMVGYLSLLVSAGLRMPALPAQILASSVFDVRGYIYKLCKKWGVDYSPEDDAFLADHPLQEMLQKFLDMNQLQQGFPLYISVYESRGLLQDFPRVLGAEFLGIDTPLSKFLHIQSLPPAQQKDALLASAALPLLFKPKYDEQGNRMTDGGQGGWIKAQGNTPIEPLLQAGCDLVIVSHLSNGSLWHRHDFPDTAIVEIRPNPALDMGMLSMLDFSESRIKALMQYGYEDTLKTMGKIRDTLNLRAELHSINAKLADDSALQASERLMEEKMALLTNRKRITS